MFAVVDAIVFNRFHAKHARLPIIGGECYNAKTMRHILLGVCGSVAAYKAAYLTRLLKREYAVQTIMTPTAQYFIGAATLRALSGSPVAVEEWQPGDDGMAHIALPRAADGFLIAPASADFIAKAAAGMADSLLLSAFLAADCPRWIAPAMNQQMWRAAATQRNIQQLADDGVFILPPADGEQACGETGDGRMMEPDDIITHVRAYFCAPLSGRRVVVSAGGTVEKIDDMRMIGNISSGKMGFYIAEAMHNIGAEVLIIAAQTTVSPPPLPLRRAMCARDMHMAAVQECRHADIFVSAAAVADFSPSAPVDGKIPRQKGDLTLQLSPTKDIVADITRQYPQLFVVGFAAQSATTTAAAQIKAARQKMRRKKTAMMVCNSAQDAGGDSSELTILSENNESHLPRQSKRTAAAALTALIAKVSRETWEKTI